MSATEGVLLLDVGNTRTKWQYRSKAGEVLAEGVRPPSISVLSRNFDLILAEVGVLQADWNEVIDAAQRIRRIEVQPEWCATVYEDPIRLGVDRWLPGLILPKAQHTLVVDAGTAVTFDFFHQGRHLGGWIVPGVSAQWHALVKGTRFEKRDMPLSWQGTWAKDSEASMFNGILYMLRQAIIAASNYENVDWNIVLCGGDSQWLDLPNATRWPDLLFDSIWNYWKRES